MQLGSMQNAYPEPNVWHEVRKRGYNNEMTLAITI